MGGQYGEIFFFNLIKECGELLNLDGVDGTRQRAELDATRRFGKGNELDSLMNVKELSSICELGLYLYPDSRS